MEFFELTDVIYVIAHGVWFRSYSSRCAPEYRSHGPSWDMPKHRPPRLICLTLLQPAASTASISRKLRIFKAHVA
jgi:hypothetical protein